MSKLAWIVRFFFAAIVIVTVPLSQSSAEPPVQGQTYSIVGGPYAGKLVWVGLIERREGLEDVVHVSIRGPFAQECMIIPLIGHVPMTAEAFESSALQVHDEAWEQKDLLRQGYNEWREAGGGVFILTVSEIIETVFVPLTQADR